MESGNLAEFNGNDSWINGTGKSGLAGMKSLTVSGWLYTTNLSHVNVLVHKESSYVLYITKSQIDFVVSNGTYSWLYTDAQSFNFKPYTWYLLTGTWNGTQINIYINGQKIGSPLTTPVFTISPDSNEVDIGVWGTWNLKVGGAIEQGYMANVQIYNGSLDEGQVSGLYADGMAASPIGGQDLLAWWPLAGNSLDSSGNGFNGVENNINFDAPGSASTATTYYIKLPGILANISETIDARIYRYSSTLNSFNTGEAPEFSQVYGQYDDGANVFNFYDNFAGTALSSKWVNNTVNSGGKLTINNGMSFARGTVGNAQAFLYSKTNFSTGVYETYGTIPAGGSSLLKYIYAAFGASNRSATNYGAAVGDFKSVYGLRTGTSLAGHVQIPGLYGGDYIWQLFVPAASPAFINASQDYGTMITSNSYVPNFPLPITFFDQNNTGINVGPFNWVRVRTYPTKNEMPNVSFGTLI